MYCNKGYPAIGSILIHILFSICLILYPGAGFARIYIDINAPSISKFKTAIPDFKNLGDAYSHKELSAELAGIIENDLDFSGYFSPMDKGAFLEAKDAPLTGNGICFKDWTVIGAELLLKGGYRCTGSNLEVEIRLYDVFRARQIVGKRAIGDFKHRRYLMHRLGNEVIRALTGHSGIFTTRLAFVGNGSGHKEIYISDYDGHNVEQITADNSIALMPRWSPDGKKIMFNSYKDGGPMLYMRELYTGVVKRVSSRPGLNTGASWAPDGQRVALTLRMKGSPDIFMINTSGKIIKRLTSHWGIDISPAFSPDGNRMAFVSNRSGSPQIYLLDLTKGTEERLTFEGKYNTSPSWSCLNSIAYSSMIDGKFEICIIDAKTGRIKRLTENTGNNEDPCWSPDGRYIVFSSNRTGRYHLYIMNASGRNQKRVTFMKGDQTSPSWTQ